MSNDDWGCDVCRAELLQGRLATIKVRAQSRHVPLQVLQCSVCQQWYEEDPNMRTYPVSPQEARAWMTKIAEKP